MGKENEVTLRDSVLQQHLKVDKFNLDEEWENQPLRYMYYAEQHVAKARELLDKKNFLNVKTAEIEMRIRTGTDDIGVKVTEGSVKAALENNSELYDIKKGIATLKEEVDILSSVVTAFEHRKKALEHEGSLLINGFYAVPDMKRTANDGQRTQAVQARKNKENE